jgi:predicted lipoprotein with Yx(FWY)xxD motif
LKGLIATFTALAVVAVAVVGVSEMAGATASRPSARRAVSPPRVQAAATKQIVMLRRTKNGRILVDGRGRALYLFEKDRPDTRTCAASCLRFWPAMTATSKPHASGGVAAAHLGLIRGPGKQRQVTYAHHALYNFSGDRKAGDTNGQGLKAFGAKWYVVAATGKAVDDD